MSEYKQKKECLLRQLERASEKDVAIAFSGGVDSSLLLKLACEAAQKKNTTVYAVTIQSELQPQKDLEIAKKVAMEAGANHAIIKIQELQQPKIQENSRERCYFCKKYLLEQLKQFALERGIEQIMEGTNVDDLHSYRPGIRAVRELGILSPLVLAGMTKQDVRMLAREYGISVSDRPSAPCLATRFPYGTRFKLEDLQKVERAEDYFHRQGFCNVRVRVYGELLRIEVDKADLPGVIVKKDSIIAYLKQLGYRYITLDLEGFRSGSMDEAEEKGTGQTHE